MTDPTNHWKLGLFLVLGAALAVAASAVVGLVGLGKDVLVFRTYFEEAVTGLEPGAFVKYRGVTIGEISSIEIAPDGRHVEVRFELDEGSVRRLGWARPAQEDELRPAVPQQLRAKLAALGVSGVKYLQLDYLDGERWPPPELPFETPAGTVPSVPSTLASLEESLVSLAEDFPAIAERSMLVLEDVRELLANVQAERVSEQMVGTLSSMQATMQTLDRKLAALPVAELSQQARQTTAQLQQTLAGLDAVLARVHGERGLLASLQRTSEAIGGIAGPAGSGSHELGATLREFRILIETLRGFVDRLERDPDMLLKGRAELR